MKSFVLLILPVLLLISSTATASEVDLNCLEKLHSDFRQFMGSSEESNTTVNDQLYCLDAGSLCYWDELKSLSSGKQKITRFIVRDNSSYICTFPPSIQNHIKFNTVALLSNSSDLIVRDRLLLKRQGIDCQSSSVSIAQPMINRYMSRLPELYTNYLATQETELESRLKRLPQETSNRENIRSHLASITQPRNFLRQVNQSCGGNPSARRQAVGKLARLTNIHNTVFPTSNGTGQNLPSNNVSAQFAETRGTETRSIR